MLLLIHSSISPRTRFWGWGWGGTEGSELTPVIPTRGYLQAWSACFNRHHMMTSCMYKRRIEGLRTMCPSASTHEDTLSAWTHTPSPASSHTLSKCAHAHTQSHSHLLLVQKTIQKQRCIIPADTVKYRLWFSFTHMPCISCKTLGKLLV